MKKVHIPDIPPHAKALLPDDTQVLEMILQAAASGLKPDTVMTVSEWADENRILSQKSSAEHGRWRTSRTPYLRDIMDAASPSNPCKRVVFQKGGQIGGTETGNNMTGFLMDKAPCPILIVQPTVQMAKRMNWQRIDPMIRDTPVLAGLVGSTYSRDSANTALAKDFPGGLLVLTGANSAVGLRSMAAKVRFLDEVDAYPADVDGEGDPISLIEVRGRTFARGKTIEVSTPKIKGFSNIERDYDCTDMRRYFVPCPGCNHMQVLVWDQFKWVNRDPATVHYECISCKYPIHNYQKQWMLANGEWRPTNDSPSEPDWIGFHLPAFYSPVGWFDWEDMVRQWLSGYKSQHRLQVFINTVLGEAFEVRGDVPEWELLYQRRDTFNHKSVPEGVLFITAGVDVQPDRIEIEYVGWGKGMRSWSLDYRILTGDVYESSVWAKLESARHARFPAQDGGADFVSRMTAIDSGYATQEVYRYVRKHQDETLMATKGTDRGASPVGQPSYVDVVLGGSKLKGQKVKRRGLALWPVTARILKHELYGWLRLNPPVGDEPDPPGYCRFPQHDPEYFKQLTAEKVMKVLKAGYPVLQWEKKRERNEVLDCRIGARAAAFHLGMDRWEDRHWDELAEAREVKEMAKVMEKFPDFNVGAIVRSSFVDT